MKLVPLLRAAALGYLALASVAALACGDDDDDNGATGSATAGLANESPPTSTVPVATSGPAATTTSAPQPAIIGVADNSFSPSPLTVKAGTKVTWTWQGRNPHSVVGTFNGATVQSPQQTAGNFEFTFASAGTFQYQCGVHGAAMPGMVRVE